jgi:hypothetical protein
LHGDIFFRHVETARLIDGKPQFEIMLGIGNVPSLHDRKRYDARELGERGTFTLSFASFLRLMFFHFECLHSIDCRSRIPALHSGLRNW